KRRMKRVQSALAIPSTITPGSLPACHAVAAQCAAAIDKLLALTNGGPSGELGPKAASLLAADIARALEAENVRLAGR
ncbi:MAG: hypothetical protein ACK5U4_00685, partial [Rhodospirillales bacterium]